MLLDDALTGSYSAQRRDFHNFVQSKTQVGQVGSLTFERVYFKGTGSGSIGLKQVHRMAYAAKDGQNVISLIAIDVEPYATTSLATAEAAILTFHKK